MYRIVHHIEKDYYTVEKRRFYIWWTCMVSTGGHEPELNRRIFNSLNDARSFIKEDSKPKTSPKKQYIYD